jgi:hypothetical protein
MAIAVAVECGPVMAGTAHVDHGDALLSYSRWPKPTAIVVDGPYGVGGFVGDPPTARFVYRPQG